MEFGRVAEEELNQVDFSLPDEPAGNKKILKGKPSKKTKVYVGCANGGELSGLGKYTRLKRKRKIFCNIMYNIIILSS